MRFGSVCSGIEAASVAWEPLGWSAGWFSEIESFPSAVLKHHWPGVVNRGDMTRFKEWPNDSIDLLVGGTPCQSFSIAGLRKGLADPRGNLMLTYLAIADRFRPHWLVWENVPGVLSSGGGRDFGTFLGGLGKLGYGFAYRILDAQYFGVPQRRRRVFVVGYLGDWRRAAAVLFERESLSGNPPPRREARKDSSRHSSPGSPVGGGVGTEVARSIRGQPGISNRPDVDTYIPDIVPQAMSSKWAKGSSGPAGDEIACFDPNQITSKANRSVLKPETCHTLPGTANSPVAFAIQERASSQNEKSGPDGKGYRDDGSAFTLEARSTPQAVAFSGKDYGADAGPVAPTLRSMGHSGSHANGGGQVSVSALSGVRRLTPRECERLQGFPDDYTLIPMGKRIKHLEQDELNRFASATGQDRSLVKWSKDGPRYKALGNSMAVPCMRWIGERIAKVEAIIASVPDQGSGAGRREAV